MDIYQLGSRLEYIKRAIRQDWSLFNENMSYDNFLLVQSGIQNLGLNGEIKKRIGLILKCYEKYKGEEKDILVDPGKTRVLNNIEALNGLILNELNEILIFEAVKECTLDKGCLIKLSNKEKMAMFDDRVWGGLSDIAKSDYSDSAKCILMGAATPAAMIP